MDVVSSMASLAMIWKRSRATKSSSWYLPANSWERRLASEAPTTKVAMEPQLPKMAFRTCSSIWSMYWLARVRFR